MHCHDTYFGPAPCLPSWSNLLTSAVNCVNGVDVSLTSRDTCATPSFVKSNREPSVVCRDTNLSATMSDHTPGTESSGDAFIMDDKPAQQLNVPPTPGYVREINRFSNTVISGATVALVRAMLFRPKTPIVTEEAPANLPPWYADQYKQRASWTAFLRQYGKDTAILTGAAYLMDAVEYAAKSIRGTDKDAGNKMIGGVAAGGLLGVMWYPQNPTGRAFMTAAGAMVGYLTYAFDRTTKVVLLEQQRKLEKELLHKSDTDIRAELDPPYLRQLLRMKQQQLVVEHKHEQDRIKQEHQQRMQMRGQGSAGGPPMRPASEQAAEERRGWSAAGSMDSSSSSSGSSQGSGPGPLTRGGLAGGLGSRAAASSSSSEQADVLQISEDDFQSAPTDGGLSGQGEGGRRWRPDGREQGSSRWPAGTPPQQARPAGSQGDWLVINEESDPPR